LAAEADATDTRTTAEVSVATPFRFRLQTLLRVRDLRERETKRNVALKQAEIARLDEANRSAAEEILRRESAMRTIAERGSIDAAELMRERAWIAHLRQQILEQQRVRACLERDLADLQEAWKRARTDLKVLEKLRERRSDEHRRAQALREQAEADDVARKLYAMKQAEHEDVAPHEAGGVQLARAEKGAATT
jgi:flagellar export protein FliJ